MPSPLSTQAHARPHTQPRLLRNALHSLCAGHTGSPLCAAAGLVPAWGGHQWADGPPKR